MTVPTARRPSAVATAVIAVAALLVLVLGGFLVFDALNGSSRHQVPQLQRWLDDMPVPTGAHLMTEQAYEANGDASAYASRQYRLPATPSSTEQVRAALTAASIRLVEDGATVPAESAPWASWTTETAGDLHGLPPGTTGSGVEVNWNGRTFTLSVQPGDVDG